MRKIQFSQEQKLTILKSAEKLGVKPAAEIAGAHYTTVYDWRNQLEAKGKGRKVISADDTFELREEQMPYGKANSLDSGNTFLWDQSPPSLIDQFLG